MSSYSDINSVFSYSQHTSRPPQSGGGGRYRDDMRDSFSDPVIEDQTMSRSTEEFTTPNYYQSDDVVMEESVRNIQSLNEIVKATVSEPHDGSDDNEYPGNTNSKSKSKKYKKEKDEESGSSAEWLWDMFCTFIKEPIIMILLYVAIHHETSADLISSYLPPSYNNPMNTFKYYGIRGFIYTVLYYTVRNYKR